MVRILFCFICNFDNFLKFRLVKTSPFNNKKFSGKSFIILSGPNVPSAFFSCEKSIVMEAAREICKDSYLQVGRPDLYHNDMVHYIAESQFAYAAGINGIMLREKPAACFYQGQFYAESLLLAETGNSIGAIQIAGTGSSSQIPFFITACDYTLIGEEFLTASAILSDKQDLLGSIRGQDIVKILIAIGITGCAFYSFLLTSGLS